MGRRVLIFGAQDTTSSALSRILYLLAEDPIIQETLRDEIRTAQARSTPERQLDHDELIALPWLDSVIKETLRLSVRFPLCLYLSISPKYARYPPVPFVRRT